MAGHVQGTRHAALALAAALLAASCGGGGGAAPAAAPAASPSPSPAGGPTNTVESQRLPYWSQASEVRPNLAHLLASADAGGPVVALSASEAAALARAPAQAAAAPRPQAQAAVQKRTVTGLVSTIWHTTAGSTQVPVNLTSALIEAWAPDGAGGFTQIAATARRADGTYAIENVPEGPHWVRRANIFVWTDSGFVDWSSDIFGRFDSAPASLPTKLNIDGGNLAPWQASDTLHWVLPMQGESYALPLATASAISNPPRATDTALAAFGMNLGDPDYLSNLLDASKGDQAYLNQLVTQPATGVRTLGKTMVLPSITTADGSTTAVTSGFLDVSANATLNLKWKRSSYAAQAAAVNPSATPSTSALGLSAFALPPSLGTPFDAYTLVEFNTLGSNDLDFGRLHYGSPFPADWNRVVDGFFGFTVRYLAPGATVAEPLERGLSSSELLDPATRDNTSLTLSPRMTPVKSPQINGRSLFANQLAVGTSPTISWTPPATGTPNYYFVRVLELRANGSRSEFVQAARFYTGATTMTPPPGLLLPGKTYVITIAAIASGAPLTQPFRSALPFSFATMMSGIVSP